MLDSSEWKSWTIKGTNLTISGYSRAGEATGFYIKELRWCLDAGVPTSQIKPERVFITHSHTDHAMMLPLLVARNKTMHVYAPKSAVPFIEGYVAGMNKMNQESADFEDRSGGYNYIPVEPGESHRLNNYKVDIIRCEHPVTSVGYLFSEKRTRLKEEFKGKAGRELGELRKKGIELNEEIFLPLFAFLGDTTDRVFQDHGEQLFQYPVIFVECTFFEHDHIEAARGSLHNHWEDLKPHVLKNPQITFVLIHFSKRFSETEICGFFEQEKTMAVESGHAGALENIILWLGKT